MNETADLESMMDDSVDVSYIKPGQDIMEDFGGFLEKRKKDKHMERNTMMSQIDGLVSNLNADLTSMMTTQQKEKLAQQKLAEKQKAAENFKAQADAKENMLQEAADLTCLESTFRATELEDSIL